MNEIDSTLDGLLAEIREARFTAGLCCVHCGDRRVHRWGSFRARQRYRCARCRRTFSDLTGTPAAYLKRLEEFARYRTCMRAATTVRAAAALLGVDKDTTFRWRHRVLDDRRQRDASRLDGLVELGEMWLPYCDKGRPRDHSSTPRPDRSRMRFRRPIVWVAFGRDRRDVLRGAVSNASHASSVTLGNAIRPFLSHRAILLSAWGRFGPHATLAARLTAEIHSPVPRRRSDGQLLHVGNVRSCILEFRAWLARFRGVSTHYLDNYISWFVFIRRADRENAFWELLEWRIEPG